MGGPPVGAEAPGAAMVEGLRALGTSPTQVFHRLMLSWAGRRDPESQFPADNMKPVQWVWTECMYLMSFTSCKFLWKSEVKENLQPIWLMTGRDHRLLKEPLSTAVLWGAWGARWGGQSGPVVHTGCDPPTAFTWLRTGFSPSLGVQWLLLPRYGVGIVSMEEGPQCYWTKPVHLSTLSKVRQRWLCWRN